MKIFKIDLDMIRQTKGYYIELAEDDYGSSQLEITLESNGEPYDLTGVTAIEIPFKTPRGTIYVHDLDNGVEITDSATGKITCTISTQALGDAGRVFFDMRIFKGLTLATSTPMTLYVRRPIITDSSITDMDQYPVLQALIIQCQAITDEEIVRVAQEAARVEAEDDRDDAEGLRAAAETARNNAEGLRDEAETSRSNAEGLRDSAETARDNAEGLRADAEIARGSAEGLRAEAETARETAEGLREQGEIDRNNAYALAETARDGLYDVAETARNGLYDTAEGARDDLYDTAETARDGQYATAESGRDTDYGLAEDARDDLFDAAEVARNAAMATHIADTMPHQFTDLQGDKKYWFGFRVSAEGKPQMIYKEVV